MLPLAVVLAFVAAVLLHFIQKRHFSSNAVTIAGHIPLIGHSLLVMKHQEDLLEWLWGAATYALGKPFQFAIVGSKPFLCICSPKDVKHILADNFDNYEKGPLLHDKFLELLGQGIFNADGAQWSYQRKTASHLFKRKELSGFMMETFVDHAQLALRKLEDAAESGHSLDLQDIFYRYTLESIGKIAFGVNLGCFEHEEVEFAVSFDRAQQIIMERIIDPFWVLRKHLAFLHPDERKLKQCVHKLEGIANGIIDSRREVGDLAERQDLLSRFLSLKDESGQPLDNARLRDVVMSFVIAGRDTTANCLTWAFYQLHKHPEVLSKLKEEIDANFNGVHTTYDVLNSGMPYLHAVVKETLRLHPSVPKDVKTALASDVLPSGTKVPAGTNVIYMPWVMGRLESLWDDATAFKPERWLKGDPEPTHFEYTAFNAGPRLCLGMNMAYLEAKVMIAMILQKYDVAVEPGQSFKYLVTLTMPMRDGLHAKLREREL